MNVHRYAHTRVRAHTHKHTHVHIYCRTKLKITNLSTKYKIYKEDNPFPCCQRFEGARDLTLGQRVGRAGGTLDRKFPLKSPGSSNNKDTTGTFAHTVHMYIHTYPPGRINTHILSKLKYEKA